ncbi:ABC transporter [Wohlfahrtiimonas chitiniclastica]|uniref:ABC-type arginine transport system, permease component n=2 Tax=Wohlfahrtiimonas chitiniclastica TaxID=400946 RepID=L8XYJ0_9GAMM|nr:MULTISPECIES: ABC transporter permease subunit [Wohlfahrtiimonas]ELV09093.1 ABC-type arginine transport system, permease component [Wohlfahrtiimonas chitiniclastica SH04]KZX37743.1 ABC transporter [Wohlfahrtiimonas chitiniclastica]MBS7814681.1 ABC transporter permease subunit [Wohlfahrtiimonas chitiniclastica]MBS7817167.1 ABC transporter permease subunit [Wohlfahrtiimonas chitiniclastica]MBS7818897.1 ABC transporter permease subunit [Wohlfahrtiimonas chitiniclastica]
MLDSLFSNFDGFFLSLLKGAVVTLELSLLSLGIGLVIAIVFALLELSRWKIIRYPVALIVNVIRALPELLVIVFMAFGVPYALIIYMDDAPDISTFSLGVAALSLIFASYASQTLRGALQAVPQSQWESCEVLGISKTKAFISIIMPQMWRHALPGLGNQWLVLLKDTALISWVGVTDLMKAGQEAATATNEFFSWLLVAAFIYLGISLVSQQIQKGFQLFLTRHERA